MIRRRRTRTPLRCASACAGSESATLPSRCEPKHVGSQRVSRYPAANVEWVLEFRCYSSSDRLRRQRERYFAQQVWITTHKNSASLKGMLNGHWHTDATAQPRSFLQLAFFLGRHLRQQPGL